LLARIRTGATGDVAILTARGIDDLIEAGPLVAGGRVDVAVSFEGIAVRAGAAKRDTASVAAPRGALLGARRVTYSKIGACGIFFADPLVRRSLADTVKTLVVRSGFTAERPVGGEADVAMQQKSEPMVVEGIEVVGPPPTERQTPAMVSDRVFSRAAHRAEATAFARFLSDPAAVPIRIAPGPRPPREPDVAP
jgi:molybdate transport system substrate-binding protein